MRHGAQDTRLYIKIDVIYSEDRQIVYIFGLSFSNEGAFTLARTNKIRSLLFLYVYQIW